MKNFKKSKLLILGVLLVLVGIVLLGTTQSVKADICSDCGIGGTCDGSCCVCCGLLKDCYTCCDTEACPNPKCSNTLGWCSCKCKA